MSSPLDRNQMDRNRIPDTLRALQDAQIQREKSHRETEKVRAARHVWRVSTERGWTDRERDDVLGALGLAKDQPKD